LGSKSKKTVPLLLVALSVTNLKMSVAEGVNPEKLKFEKVTPSNVWLQLARLVKKH
jgi:hypothetical protein